MYNSKLTQKLQILISTLIDSILKVNQICYIDEKVADRFVDEARIIYFPT